MMKTILIVMTAFLLEVARGCSQLECDHADTYAETYNGRSKSLQEVPNDIPLSVTNIELCQNKISHLKSGSFSKLHMCKTLKLYYNRISNIEEGAFEGLEKLSGLSLESNKLKELRPGMWKGLEDVDGELNLGNNQITRLTADAFVLLSKCKCLYLSYNQIQDIQGGAFNGLTSLKNLYLDHNKLTELNMVFKGLTNLLYLHLEGNQIKELKSGVLANLGLLEGLYLSENEITKVDGGMFHGLTQLRELYLKKNKIKSFSLQVFLSEMINNEEGAPQKQTLYLNLGYNQLLCNSSLCWLQEAIDEGNIAWTSRCLIGSENFWRKWHTNCFGVQPTCDQGYIYSVWSDSNCFYKDELQTAVVQKSQNMTTVPLVESNNVSSLGIRDHSDTDSDKNMDEQNKERTEVKGVATQGKIDLKMSSGSAHHPFPLALLILICKYLFKLLILN